MTGYEPHDLMGNLGVLFILVTYVLLQLEKVDVSSLTYSALNAAGAALILYSLLYDFNLSAFLIESAWLAISLYGLARQFFKKPSNEADGP
ncbi:MAG: hypothetical protein JJ934_12300 [Pseudomonadales bacterium]|nr:hypothetical protein [Pseudomonadales bacterium]MBO6564680.1 hypothetical protein [Pseudomonadales bacterium]MBO6596468.1 hypothetical protein [Pseudomonadales bacterium]MBO6657674.1 hypothetical protein [Pseudomonadales bacterium]MBO6704358.1 hypothetical protein [Pseudomonadales bacterium]